MRNTNDCTIVVSTCDAYRDLWPAFFALFKRYWPDCPYKIVLNTETLDFQWPGLEIEAFGFGENMTWGKRLRKTLKKIQTDQVLMLLDDFFLQAPVDTERLENCMHWMQQNPEIANFSLFPDYFENLKDERFEDFELRKRVTAYVVNCQAGLWNRKELISLLRDHENAWQFEEFGTIRARYYKTHKKFYILANGAPLIFDYPVGGAIHRGKWRQDMPELLAREHVEMDFSKRGFIEDDVLEQHILPDPEIKVPFAESWWGRKHDLSRYVKNWRSYF